MVTPGTYCLTSPKRALAEARPAVDDLVQFERTTIELRTEERSRPDYLSPDHAWQWETVAGGATLDIHERLSAMVLDTWVERGGVKPALFRQNGRRSIRLGGYGLLGALAIQLVFDVCRSDGLAICTSCGTPYLPARRRPRRDQNPYCPDCGVQGCVARRGGAVPADGEVSRGPGATDRTASRTW
jgi:hypothetical protein